jgi:hypothetical protein
MGGQFGVKKGGQFEAKIHGQLPAESGDLFKRNFQPMPYKRCFLQPFFSSATPPTIRLSDLLTALMHLLLLSIPQTYPLDL